MNGKCDDLRLEILKVNEKMENANTLSELFSLSDKKSKYCRELYYSLPSIKSNGVIELRLQYKDMDKDLCGIKRTYDICLCANKKVIGIIKYSGYHNDKYLGDIGYRIASRFRGNNYSYQALCLLGELLKENGINDFWISAEKENIPSIKVIEKYGGIPIFENSRIKCYCAKTFIDSKKRSDEVHK